MQGEHTVHVPFLWLTTCVSGSLGLHISHGKPVGGSVGSGGVEGLWKGRKRWGGEGKRDKHMVLVWRTEMEQLCFVPCNVQRKSKHPPGD